MRELIQEYVNEGWKISYLPFEQEFLLISPSGNTYSDNFKKDSDEYLTAQHITELVTAAFMNNEDLEGLVKKVDSENPQTWK